MRGQLFDKRIIKYEMSYLSVIVFFDKEILVTPWKSNYRWLAKGTGIVSLKLNFNFITKYFNVYRNVEKHLNTNTEIEPNVFRMILLKGLCSIK